MEAVLWCQKGEQAVKQRKTYQGKVFLCLLFLVLLFALSIFFYRWWQIPRPLEVDVEGASVWTVQVRAPADAVPVRAIEGWEEQALLDCLSRCIIHHPNPFASKSFSLHDVEFVIKFDLGDRSGDNSVCELRMGEGYHQMVVNGVPYSMVNHEAIHAELRYILAEWI